MAENGRSIMVDLVDGAIAGAVATWAMGKVTTYLYEHEDQQAREREDAARDGKTSYGVAAEKAAQALGRTLTEEERQRYGSALHWVLGIVAGAAYGALRRRLPAAHRAHGGVFGTAFFLTMDEIVTPALGLTPGPAAFPWQAHARGAAGHLAFGTVADVTLHLLQGSSAES